MLSFGTWFPLVRKNDLKFVTVCLFWFTFKANPKTSNAREQFHNFDGHTSLVWVMVIQQFTFRVSKFYFDYTISKISISQNMGKGGGYNLAFGAWLTSELENVGLSGYALAKHAGCDPKTVSMICKGEIKNPSETMMERLRTSIDEIKSGITNQISDKDKTDAIDFSEWLRLQMEAKSLNRNQLAKLAGCHHTTLTAILNRRIENPSNEMMEKLRNALDEEIPQKVADIIKKKKIFENKQDVWDDFNPHDHDSIPNKPGVYALFSPTNVVMYVGKAQNVRSRIASHREKKWFLEDIIEYGMLFYSDDPDDRTRIEDILIKFLRSNAWLNKAGRYKPKKSD
jgi:transcriptional regulator with XRE-family HTH domain